MTRSEAKALALSKCVTPFRGKVLDVLAQSALELQAAYNRMAEEQIAGLLASVLDAVPDASVLRVHDEIIVEMPVPVNSVNITALLTQYGVVVQEPQSVPLVSPG